MEQYSRPLKVFISYSHSNTNEKDVITRLLLQSGNRFEILSDTLLQPGDNWREVLMRMRDEADVFLLLISQFYLDSRMIPSHEMPQIMRRGDAREAYVIPIILDHCSWDQEPFAKWQAVPGFGRPITDFENKEDAYAEVTEALDSLYYLVKNHKALDIIKRARETQSTSLDLSNCNLYSIPRDIADMKWVTSLALQKNKIRKIDSLERLVNLTYLDLSDNEIRTIEKLDQLTNLDYLDLERNRLTEITGLENCLKLELLGLSTNNIEVLSGIAHLDNLKILYAARNRIADISILAGLKNLTRIVLTDNQIISIRSLLPRLSKGLSVHLKYALNKDETGLFLRGNPISDPPLEVIALGTNAIVDHFAKGKRHGEKKLEVLKLILMGNSGVGKTNFSQFLRKQKLNESHVSTDTLEIQSWKAPFLKSESGEMMLVNIFDFGGQDYYHDLHRLYYSHDTAYVLLWDTATNLYAERKEQLPDKSELIYEDFPIEYWLESIRYILYGKEPYLFNGAKKTINVEPDNTNSKVAVGPEAPIVSEEAVVKADLTTSAPVLLLQNKIDKGEGLLNQVLLREKYPNITTFFNVSLAKNSRVGSIEEVLDSCLGKLNLAGRKLVTYQHEIIEKYLETKLPFEVLTLAEFKDKCELLIPRYKGTLDISDAKTIASVLTNLGALYFDHAGSDDNDANSIVFTSIGELNDLIKQLMNEAKQGSSKGVFFADQVKDFKYIGHILPLLLKNNSVIRLNQETYLVPQFLPVAAESHIANFARAFVHCHIRYIYTAYFHKLLVMSLFSKFVSKNSGGVESDNSIKAIYYWRNGLILSQETTDRPQMAYIRFLKEPNACRIEIRTLYPFGRTGLEREIEKEMDELNKGWSFTKEVSINSKDFFEVNAMISQVKGKNFIFPGSKQNFTVNDFKHLVNFEKVPKKLFVSYSSKNAEFVKRFWTHLDVLRAAGYIEPWYDRKIEAGTKWDDSIQKEMLSSDIVIFLLSPDFLATPYIMNEEVKNAMEMENNKQCELFFIQLLHCSWGETELKKYQLILDPDNSGKEEYFIGNPGNDEAWKKIIKLLTAKVQG
ncbi:TIR domain-containing protein [Flavitalea antarctica]